MKKKNEVDDISSFSRKYRKKVFKSKNNRFSAKICKERHRFFRNVWAFMVVSLAGMLSFFSVFGMIDMLAMNREEQSVNVCIDDKKNVSKLLFDSKVISEPEFFDTYLAIFNKRKNIVCGTFRIKTNLDYSAIVNYLSQNNNRLDSDIVEVTIPEGKNVLEIADILEKKGVCKKDAFLDYCKKGDFSNFNTIISLKNYSELVYKPEGYLFPDTYKLYKNVEPKYVVRKFVNNYRNKIAGESDFNDAQSIEEKAKVKNMDLQDLINIAALIQAEAADEKDMYNVSSVIHNRLDVHNKKVTKAESGLEKLSIDATVWYPYRSKDKVPKDLVNGFESPYDTYKGGGLPIGPICSPGLKAIDAALKPNKTNYYYYCHSKNGKAYYARNLKEHNANLKKAGLA